MKLSKIFSTVCCTCLALLLALGTPSVATGEPPQPQAPAGAQGLSKEQAEALRTMLNLPPGTKVEVEISSKDGGTVRTIQRGKGVGAGAVAEGDKLSDSISGSAPEVGFGDGSSATGGSVDRKSKADALKVPAVPWQNPLFWIGVLMLAGSGVLFYLRLPLVTKELKLGLAGVGVACIAVAFYPALLIWGVVVIVGYLAFMYIKSHSSQGVLGRALSFSETEATGRLEALRAVAAGVDDPTLPPDVRDAVKARIAAHAEPADVALIDAVKRADRLGKYAP